MLVNNEKSITNAVKEVVNNDLSFQDSLQRDYCNISALTRIIKPQVDQLLGDFRSTRFGYVEASDGSWGLSLARPGWVKEQIERSPLELVSYERGAWKPPHPAQDVAVCTVPTSE